MLRTIHHQLSTLEPLPFGILVIELLGLAHEFTDQSNCTHPTSTKANLAPPIILRIAPLPLNESPIFERLTAAVTSTPPKGELLFLVDSRGSLRDWPLSLHRALQRLFAEPPQHDAFPTHGLVGCQLVTRRVDPHLYRGWRGLVVSAGVDVDYGAGPDDIIPYHRYVGAPLGYVPANRPANRSLACVAPHGMLLSQLLWQQCSELFPMHSEFDLCHCTAIGSGQHIAYEPDCVVLFDTAPEELVDTTSSTAALQVPAAYATWLRRTLESRMPLPRGVTFLLEAGANCSGVNVEAMTFALALSGKLDMAILFRRGWCAGMPTFAEAALQRMARRRLPFPISIAMALPLPWGPLPRFDQVIYYIGRRLGEQAGEHCGSCLAPRVDELWVPAAFLKDNLVAIDHFEPDRVAIIPEPTDVWLFDPSLYDSERAIGGSQKDDSQTVYTFLSVFKWEVRKNWKALLSAYWREFSDSTDRIRLKLLTWNSDAANENEKRNTTLLWHQIHRHYEVLRTVGDAEGVLAVNWDALPTVDVDTQYMTGRQMPLVYLAADCFVLPTHGEGWGLPVVEAMAMGLPTIATNWSAITEYLTEDNGFPLQYTLTPVRADVPNGPHWAEPSIADLRRLMRWVFEHRDEARAKGARARQTIVERYNLDKIADIVIHRLQYLVNTRDELKVVREKNKGA